MANSLMNSYPVLVFPGAIKGALEDFYQRLDSLLSSKAKKGKSIPSVQTGGIRKLREGAKSTWPKNSPISKQRSSQDAVPRRGDDQS
jgi:hypothetical protein